MKESRRYNLGRSIMISVWIYLVCFYLFAERRDEYRLLTLIFVCTQFFFILISALLFLLRLFRIFKNSISLSYHFTGTFQFFLAATDTYLLLVNRSIIRYSLLAFLTLNLFFGIFIFRDIYKAPTA